MRKEQTIAVWIIISALYIAGCFWLYFGTLSFDGLDLLMQPEDACVCSGLSGYGAAG